MAVINFQDLKNNNTKPEPQQSKIVIEDKREFLLFLYEKALIERNTIVKEIERCSDVLNETVLFGIENNVFNVSDIKDVMDNLFLPVVSGKFDYESAGMAKQIYESLRQSIINDLAKKYAKEFESSK